MPAKNESLQAEKVIDFIETFLTLGGSFNGKKFILEPFQRDIIYDLYKENENGERLRREYLVGLPRKNGKSQLGSALALYHLVADTSDSNPVVISAAGDREQARLVFAEAARMVRASPTLSKRLTVQRNQILNPKNNGVYRVVSADAGLQQGLNPTCVIFDELHIFKNADLIDAMRLGQGMRKFPLLIVITTAGYDLTSPLGKLYQYGCKVNSGEVKDDAFGMTWYGPPEGDNWDYRDPAIWKMCNPAWAIMPNPEAFFATTINKTSENQFIRYFLNGWTDAEEAWLPAGAWAALEKPGRKLERDEPVVLGFDGAWVNDSTAVVAVSLLDYHVELIGLWEKPAGHNDHWRTPRDEVRYCIVEAFKYYNVKVMLADPYRFEELIFELSSEDGLPVMEYPTNSAPNMVKACQVFYEGVMAQEMSWSNDTETGISLSRHMNNAIVKSDHRGMRIVKETSVKKMDAAIAAVLAYHGAKLYEDEEELHEFELIVL